jgi:hypothetical protein
MDNWMKINSLGYTPEHNSIARYPQQHYVDYISMNERQGKWCLKLDSGTLEDLFYFDPRDALRFRKKVVGSAEMNITIKDDPLLWHIKCTGSIREHDIDHVYIGIAGNDAYGQEGKWEIRLNQGYHNPISQIYFRSDAAIKFRKNVLESIVLEAGEA